MMHLDFLCMSCLFITEILRVFMLRIILVHYFHFTLCQVLPFCCILPLNFPSVCFLYLTIVLLVHLTYCFSSTYLLLFRVHVPVLSYHQQILCFRGLHLHSTDTNISVSLVFLPSCVSICLHLELLDLRGCCLGPKVGYCLSRVSRVMIYIFVLIFPVRHLFQAAQLTFAVSVQKLLGT